MFFYFYPLNGLAAYEYGTAMGRMLMDMKAIADRQKNTGNDIYYAVLDNVSSGPFSLEEIRALIREGKILRETYIWKPGMEKWDFALNIAELHAMVSLAPPPLPQDTNEEVETDDSCQRSTH
ncbi:MAG: DUF4339 domain-containing protein [Ruminococcus sp.]